MSICERFPRLKLTIGVALLLALPAAAQEIDPAAPAACLEAARHAVRVGALDPDALPGCVGSAADACMAGSGEVTTTLDMSRCYSGEAGWWDARLNEVYGQLHAELVTREGDLPGGVDPTPAQSMREMQRAWIGWRDALCAHAANEFPGGSAAGPARASCVLRETARQTLSLARELDSLQER